MVRIYADFHAIGPSSRDPSRTMVPLDALASLRDLCNAGLRLREELPLVVWGEVADGEELEADAIAHFDPLRAAWIAELCDEVAYVPASGEPVAVFLCLGCRRDLSALLAGIAPPLASIGLVCQHCGTMLIAAVAPP
jgi:hypothetical protein